MKSEGSYQKGRKTGPWNSWYEDGREKASGMFVDGKKIGKWTYWDKDGKKTEVQEGDLPQPSGGK